jgi:hypothetical protein
MLKAVGKTSDGKPVVLIGLSFANLDRLRAGAGDDHIRIDGPAMGIPFDILICAGRTEADLAALIAPGLEPDAKIYVDPKLRN